MGKRQSTNDQRAKRFKLANGLLSEGLFSKGSAVKDWDNEEQSFELQPRRARLEEVDALPIKRAGIVERKTRNVVPKEESDDESDHGSEDGSDAEDKDSSEQEAVPCATKDTIAPIERLRNIKEQVALLASQVMEDPEENVSALVSLRKLAQSPDVVTGRLAVLALVPVFKSLAPGYRIRPLTEAEQRVKVAKDLARQRRFELALVTNYRDYIELLGKHARVSAMNSQNRKGATAQQIKQGYIATKAACELCNSSLRHFNYSEELLTILIRRLNRRPIDALDLEVFTLCLRTLETLFKDDKEHGALTFSLVRILCKVIRDKNFRVDEAVVNVLLSLSLLDDYDPTDTKKAASPKTKKKDRVHLSKKQRKQRKELKAIDEEMRKAEQALTAEEREKYQSDTLKQVFKLYLEVLKDASVNEDSAAKLLVAAVMEGLARFGQMANFELLGDFLEVLKETMNGVLEAHALQTDIYGIEKDLQESSGIFTPQEVRKLLLCISAAFSLVLNHVEAGRLPFSFDLSTFIKALHLVVLDVAVSADLEFSHKSLRLADPLAASNVPEKPAVNVSTNAELFIKCLDFVFFRSRSGSLACAIPFVKRLYMALLQMPERTSIATLKFVAKLTVRYGNGLHSLWSSEDRIVADGNYVLGIEKENMEVALERMNVGSAVLWENVLLDKHYCNIIKDGARSIMKSSKETKPR